MTDEDENGLYELDENGNKLYKIDVIDDSVVILNSHIVEQRKLRRERIGKELNKRFIMFRGKKGGE